MEKSLLLFVWGSLGVFIQDFVHLDGVPKWGKPNVEKSAEDRDRVSKVFKVGKLLQGKLPSKVTWGRVKVNSGQGGVLKEVGEVRQCGNQHS